VVVGIGATVKQPALLTALALPLITCPWKSWALRDSLVTIGRVLASLATAVGTFILVSVITRLGFGWVNSVSVPGRSLTVAPFTLLGLAYQHVAGWFGVTLNQTHTIAMARGAGIAFGIVIIVFLALTLARRRPIAFLAWGYLAAAITGPALRSWYVQWSITLLPLTRLSRTMVRVSVWGILVMFGFDAMFMSMRNSAVAICVGALLAMAWVAWNHLPLVRTNGKPAQPQLSSNVDVVGQPKPEIAKADTREDAMPSIVVVVTGLAIAALTTWLWRIKTRSKR